MYGLGWSGAISQGGYLLKPPSGHFANVSRPVFLKSELFHVVPDQVYSPLLQILLITCGCRPTQWTEQTSKFKPKMRHYSLMMPLGLKEAEKGGVIICPITAFKSQNLMLWAEPSIAWSFGWQQNYFPKKFFEGALSVAKCDRIEGRRGSSFLIHFCAVPWQWSANYAPDFASRSSTSLSKL